MTEQPDLASALDMALNSMYEMFDGELAHPVIDCCDPHRGLHGAWVEMRDLPEVEAVIVDNASLLAAHDAEVAAAAVKQERERLLAKASEPDDVWVRVFDDRFEGRSVTLRRLLSEKEL